MKKFVLVIIIIGALISVSIVLIFIYPYLFGPKSKDDDGDGTLPPGLVYIYVNSTIYNSISPEIATYQQDVKNQGYYVRVINWSINNVTLLKQNLTDAKLQNLIGAVLIGKLPYANLKHHNSGPGFPSEELFPCDLYLMDLDGNWTDKDPSDGFFDNYTAGAGDVDPEIWVGRIYPESLNNMDHLKAYQDYFSRNHAYRTGQLKRPHSALLYNDDDWVTYSTTWGNEIKNAYPNTTIYDMPSWTNATNYEWELTQLYEFIHLAAHSNPLTHSFSGELTNSTEILNIDTKALFFNLFCCSAARFNETNNLGIQYLFSNNTLAVVGSAKTGGMWENSAFYTPLSQGDIMGEAFREFFIYSFYGPNDDYNVGLVFLGDPLLTIF